VVRAAGAAILIALAWPGAAAVMAPASVEALARGSDAVVRGRVLDTAARWSADGRRIVTEVEVAVSAVWRGLAPGRVRVTVPGGERDGVAQRVEGAPAFSPGEEAVLFLVRRGPSWRVRGLALGKYRLEGGVARPELGGVAFAPGRVPEGERLAGEMPAGELERRVRGTR
jgi:hypothetical protein